MNSAGPDPRVPVHCFFDCVVLRAPGAVNITIWTAAVVPQLSDGCSLDGPNPKIASERHAVSARSEHWI